VPSKAPTRPDQSKAATASGAASKNKHEGPRLLTHVDAGAADPDEEEPAYNQKEFHKTNHAATRSVNEKERQTQPDAAALSDDHPHPTQQLFSFPTSQWHPPTTATPNDNDPYYF
jgi:hypothetical protein